MNRRWGASAVAKLGLLAAVAIVLGYFEHLLPVTGIPGVKLGLANTVLLYALYLLDVPSAILLMLLKVGLSGLLYGGPAAMLYSFAGGALSLFTMILAQRSRGLSVVGVSVLGAVAHNVAQMLVACFFVETRAILAYLPVLLVAASVTGTLTGLIARYSFRGLKPKAARDTQQETEAAKNSKKNKQGANNRNEEPKKTDGKSKTRLD
ncbi:MAG: Gx transporter family protein [Eubacteriales bacterium]|jgi:heptaprenyl diphosphate synthase|nr:Gx transporter family protein [Eubacteriales bacterium]